MAPHIVFHKPEGDYFPSPGVWRTDRTGLVAIIHHWESDRDNSIDWDLPFTRVLTEGAGSLTRRDTSHANPEHRPMQQQYERYILLVQHFRRLGWDNSRLHNASPFQVVDPGFNTILPRSCLDIGALATKFGETEIAQRGTRQAARGQAAIESLWSDPHDQFLYLNRTIGNLIDNPSIGGLLAMFADTRREYGARIASRIRELATRARFLLPSHDPAAPELDGDRYWRGPV